MDFLHVHQSENILKQHEFNLNKYFIDMKLFFTNKDKQMMNVISYKATDLYITLSSNEQLPSIKIGQSDLNYVYK